MVTNKLKVIKDYEKLSEELLDLLRLEYPNGFSNSVFQYIDPKTNKLIRAVELETEEKLYLIRLPLGSTFTTFDADLDDFEIDVDIDPDLNFIEDKFNEAGSIAEIDIQDEIEDDDVPEKEEKLEFEEDDLDDLETFATDNEEDDNEI
ncbi:MAG: hypothetical protein LBV69_09485 [Bacteroidales bacterium]|jgi:hypothetical protein|nr:hypothetical protein [Bacteroidales bacterium]